VGFGPSTFSEVDYQPYECRGVIKTHLCHVEHLPDVERARRLAPKALHVRLKTGKRMLVKRENRNAETMSFLSAGSHFGVLNDRVERIKVPTQLVLPSYLVFKELRRYALSSLRLRPDPDRGVVAHQA
jgi:hypothetical protein